MICLHLGTCQKLAGGKEGRGGGEILNLGSEMR